MLIHISTMNVGLLGQMFTNNIGRTITESSASSVYCSNLKDLTLATIVAINEAKTIETYGTDQVLELASQVIREIIDNLPDYNHVVSVGSSLDWLPIIYKNNGYVKKEWMTNIPVPDAVILLPGSTLDEVELKEYGIRTIDLQDFGNPDKLNITAIMDSLNELVDVYEVSRKLHLKETGVGEATTPSAIRYIPKEPAVDTEADELKPDKDGYYTVPVGAFVRTTTSDNRRGLDVATHHSDGSSKSPTGDSLDEEQSDKTELEESKHSGQENNSDLTEELTGKRAALQIKASKQEIDRHVMNLNSPNFSTRKKSRDWLADHGIRIS